MITKEKSLEKICSFYASDYHLEMIMIPYINRKIEEKSKIVILTQKNLKETAEVVLSRINLSKQRKEEILNLGWKNKSINETIKENNIENQKEIIFFVIGDTKYILDANNHISNNLNQCDLKVIDCYNLEEAQENMIDIVSHHDKVLNTTEEKKIG